MSYARLHDHMTNHGHLQHVGAILQWDEAVIMPPAAGPSRAAATATLHGMIHDMLVDPRLPDWIEAARAEPLEARQQANLREIEHAVRRARALPADLVRAMTRASMTCEQAWRSMRADNDFAGFSPRLQEVVELKRQQAQCLSEALSLSPYDALLDEFDPGSRSVDVDVVFQELRTFLPALIDAVIEHQAAEPAPLDPRGPFPVEAQARLGRELMAAVGFDLSHGRLDVSHHPFCGGVPTDVRITTRYDEADFQSALMGVLHETGHAKYEQGLPRDWLDQPAGHARGMAIHESQSLLQEMQVCRSLPFMQFLAGRAAAAFPEAYAAQPAAFTADNLYRRATRVQRSKIRVDADEVTYPCHILLRYDLERALVAGDMAVADLPAAWDAGMRELLRVETGDDYRDGCMQDVHWPSGAFGYFPSYTLGAMTAAQLFSKAREALPSLEADIARGQLGGLDTFLRERVWSQASFLSPQALLEQATGETLHPRFFEAHLRRRYLGA